MEGKNSYKLLDFLIFGVAKCGTTAIAKYFSKNRNKLHAIKKHFGIFLFLQEVGNMTLKIIKLGVKGDIK